MTVQLDHELFDLYGPKINVTPELVERVYQWVTENWNAADRKKYTQGIDLRRKIVEFLESRFISPDEVKDKKITIYLFVTYMNWE